MNLTAIRKLAKSINYQILYSRAKELGTIKLFNNDSDYSNSQIWFLYYLELYDSLYTDLHMKENYITEEVIKDDIRMEAYLLYKRINKDKKNPKKTGVDTSGDNNSVIFKRR